MPFIIVRGKVKKMPDVQPSPRGEAAEKAAKAKEQWKKAKKAAKKEAEKKARVAEGNATNSPQGGMPSPVKGGSPGTSMRALIDRAKTSMASTQADTLERMLANAANLSEESKGQLAVLLHDIKQKAKREEHVNTGWKCLKQSAAFVRHVSEKQDRPSPLAGPGSFGAGAAGKDSGGIHESEPPSPAIAQWNKVKSLKSVASLAKETSFAKVLQQQAESPPSKSSKLDQGDGVYADASSFRRRQPSEWGKVKADSESNVKDEVDEEQDNSRSEESLVEDPTSPSKYVIRLPKGVLEREMARQEHEKDLGKIAKNAAQSRAKKLEILHSEEHQGPLVGYSRKFGWTDLCLAASNSKCNAVGCDRTTKEATLLPEGEAQRGESSVENFDSEETAPARKTRTERHNYTNSHIHSHVHSPSDRLPQAMQPLLPVSSRVQQSRTAERKGSDEEVAEGREGGGTGRCGNGKGEDAELGLGLSQRKNLILPSLFGWFLRGPGRGAGI
jgi:hypothetical protein